MQPILVAGCRLPIADSTNVVADQQFGTSNPPLICRVPNSCQATLARPILRLSSSVTDCSPRRRLRQPGPRQQRRGGGAAECQQSRALCDRRQTTSLSLRVSDDRQQRQPFRRGVWSTGQAVGETRISAAPFSQGHPGRAAPPHDPKPSHRRCCPTGGATAAAHLRASARPLRLQPNARG